MSSVANLVDRPLQFVCCISIYLPYSIIMNKQGLSNRSDMQWYVIKVQSNREKSIRDSLLRRIKRDGFESMFGQIIVPVERFVDTKLGKKRVVEQKLFPGYLLVEMVLDDDTWFLVRNVSGVGDFTGSSGKPVPMHEAEIAKILSRNDSQVTVPSIHLSTFGAGDAVVIKDGAFDGFKGVIHSVDNILNKVTVLIEIFGRPTPISLESWQVRAE